MGQLGQRRGCSFNAVETRDTLKWPPFFLPAPSGSPRLRLDVWEKGNISIVQLEEKLRTAARQALADAIMELWLLPAPLCTEDTPTGTWSLENPRDPGEAVFQVRMPGESGETWQRLHLKYTFNSCPSPSLHQQGDTLDRNVCVQLVTQVRGI